MDEKQCKRCFAILPLTFFYKNSRGKNGRYHICRFCCCHLAKLDRTYNYEARAATKYKTTASHISELQNKLYCDICGKLPSKRKHCIDHDHKTGKIRGLLCDSCNKGIGNFCDSIELLEKAKDYLIKYE